MAAAGVDICVDITDLGTVGWFDHWSHLPRYVSAWRFWRREIRTGRPRAAVVIDIEASEIVAMVGAADEHAPADGQAETGAGLFGRDEKRGSRQPPEAGKPGWYYGAGTHLSPNDPWWPMAKPFLEYLGRASFLLQQGLFVADVLYYYGDQGLNFVPPKHVDPSLGYGYDYDVTNPEVILTRLGVRNGRLTLPDGMSYELLVLPERQRYPNLASRVLGLALKRLSADWQQAWGHPVVLVESYVDESQYRGTCYRACGFQATGLVLVLATDVDPASDAPQA
jgi:hypothetical protein